VGPLVTPEDPLARQVHARDGDKPFGRFTLADVQARAGELAAITAWGPMTRVASVARGWSELARAMQAADAATVGDLDRDAAVEFARRLWVVPPAGSLL
jgi:hypothetical protein